MWYDSTLEMCLTPPTLSETRCSANNPSEGAANFEARKTQKDRMP